MNNQPESKELYELTPHLYDMPIDDLRRLKNIVNARIDHYESCNYDEKLSQTTANHSGYTRIWEEILYDSTESQSDWDALIEAIDRI